MVTRTRGEAVRRYECGGTTSLEHKWSDWICTRRISPGSGRGCMSSRADQARPEDLLEIVDQAGPPSVVVDDGSHLGADVRISLTTLFPLLAPGGWYVIEDLATSFLPEFGGDEAAGPTTSLGVVDDVTRHAQAADPTFSHSDRDPPLAALADVAEVHTYPGICFIREVVVSPPGLGATASRVHRWGAGSNPVEPKRLGPKLVVLRRNHVGDHRARRPTMRMNSS